MSEPVKIKVVGVGGSGLNAVNYLMEWVSKDVSFAVVDTDAQSLHQSNAPEKLLIGHDLSRGLSTGGDPAIASKAAKGDTEPLEALLSGADLIFLVAGLGGGTGSGATPYIAEIAKNLGAFVISFCPLPFSVEGGRRYQLAQNGLNALQQHSHATIPLPNDILLQNLPPEATVLDAFNLANTWVERALTSILNMLHKPGIINLDFASLRNAFSNAGGKSLFGITSASGEDYVQCALNDLSLCPLLHIPQASQFADTLLINITGGRDLSLKDTNHIATYLAQRFNSKENTVIGAVIDDSLYQSVDITIIGSTDPSRRTRKKSRSALDPNQQVLFDEVTPSPLESLMPTEDSDSPPNDRGYFLQTEPILIDGEDLDIPTYLRHGITIRL